MTAGAGLFLVLAVGDWIFVERGDKQREYFFKPATMVVLIVLAATLDPISDGRRAWFVVALVLSLAGDVFLMLPRDLFVAGLASFLLAHVAYIVGLRIDDGPWTGVLVWVAVMAAVASVIARPIVANLRRDHPDLVAPVVVYMGAISLMVASALATGIWLAAAGALVFYASDYLIARTRFVEPQRWGPVAIMVLYHLGQAGLVLSLTSHP